ncbi:MAG TPA: HDOD domain-containing protein [Bryobacteraceae bacterium]|nr:HDOD domain-containing protein [Bryobacteraceae bacterium]
MAASAPKERVPAACAGPASPWLRSQAAAMEDTVDLSQQTVNRLCKLPVFRPVATRVLQVLSQESPEIATVSGLIQSDAGLSAELLTLANSPLWGCEGTIRSVTRAIVVLGLQRTNRLMMTVAMRVYLKGCPSLHPEAVRRCWNHCLACAMAAEELAPAWGLGKDVAYTAALLHDIGRAGLLAAFPKEYGPLLLEEVESVLEACNVEKLRFDMDHCRAGQFLVRTWGLPAEFAEISARHHEPVVGEGVVSLVQAACQCADALGFAAMPARRVPTLEELRARLPAPLEARFSCDPGKLQEKIERAISSLG